MKDIIGIIRANRKGALQGIYAVCCAQPSVIEAAIKLAKYDQVPILIEATANQVNQLGGYTGMQPKDFIKFIGDIADKYDYPKEHIVLGGDHLGPVCWVNENSNDAIAKAKNLIASYVAAGFKKIHLDTSMGCIDDPDILPDEVVAKRAADLCLVAEQSAIAHFDHSELVYVVGTEVPPPGGATEEIAELELTPVNRVEQTINLHQKAFKLLGLNDAWQRVIGLVVQPGVEFDHTSIIDYQSNKAQALSHCIKNLPISFLDHILLIIKNPQAYKELIYDHFAILDALYCTFPK